MYRNGKSLSKGIDIQKTRQTDEDSNIEHILLPNLVDQKASSCPETVWAEYPKSADTYENGYRAITYRQFANAINGAAWWLEKTMGKGQDFETLAYIGPNDVRYQILLVAAIKAGYKMFFTSPRNSVAAHSQLFKETGCRTLLVPEPRPPPVTALLNGHQIDTLDVPALEILLFGEHEHFQYKKTYHQASNDPIFVLHTSGSTDIPKPLIYTHEYITRSVAISNIKPPSGCSSFNMMHHDARIVLLLPPFHIAGVYFSIINNIYNSSPTILPLPTAIPTSQSLDAILQQTHAYSAFLPPSILEDLSKDPTLLHDVASKVSLIFWSGGPLSHAAGSMISTQIPLHTCYGSSEYGAWPELVVDSPSLSPTTVHHAVPDDSWRYFRLHPDINAKFRHRGNNHFELILPRDPRRSKYLTPFLHFPALRSAYRTRDLFEPHPQKEGYWTYIGRADDIIVFSNGEKTNPIEYESQVVASGGPDATAALVLGAGRPEAGVLIEISQESYKTASDSRDIGAVQDADGTNEKDWTNGLIEKIWPAVEKANASCPAHARVAKERILFTQKDRPFARAGKGTVQRGPTQRLYADAIDRLYSDLDEDTTYNRTKRRNVNGKSLALSTVPSEQLRDTNGALPSSDHSRSTNGASIASAQTWSSLKRKRSSGLPEYGRVINTTKVIEMVCQICRVDPPNFDPETDFFTDLGMDSVQVLQLCRALKRALGRQVEARVVFDNPSVESLNDALKIMLRT
ncbi:MAG: hypothetical protein Q9160_005983 [Pyrenula sp. 1 TL-2023]